MEVQGVKTTAGSPCNSARASLRVSHKARYCCSPAHAIAPAALQQHHHHRTTAERPKSRARPSPSQLLLWPGQREAPGPPEDRFESCGSPAGAAPPSRPPPREQTRFGAACLHRGPRGAPCRLGVGGRSGASERGRGGSCSPRGCQGTAAARARRRPGHGGSPVLPIARGP